MRKLFLIITTLLITLTGSVFSQKDGIGLGLILGEPTGISYKRWTNLDFSLNAAAAWTFLDDKGLHLHGDYVYHDFDLFYPKTGDLALYYGLGGRLKITDQVRIGMRVPIGVNYVFDSEPLDLFAEIVPIFDIIPKTVFNINIAAGIRFYIK